MFLGRKRWRRTEVLMKKIALIMRQIVLPITLMASVFVPTAVRSEGAAAMHPSVDEMVKQFGAVVFKSEFKGVKALTGIKKWSEPLRVVIKTYGDSFVENADGTKTRQLKQRRVKRLHFDYIQKHLNALTSLTGIKTEDVKKTQNSANFVINFVPQIHMTNPSLAQVDKKLLRRLGGLGGCYFLMWSDERSGLIKKAVIVVNSDRLMTRINHCLLEEMTQSLGLPNDTNMPWPSIFSNSGRITSLSRSDKILIKALYDPRMRPAMGVDDAMILARKIIGELDRTMP